MILLGIDTCGSAGTLAVAQVAAGQVVQVLAQAELAGRSAAAMLVPAVKQLLEESGLLAAEIEGLVVVDGPGSFTGIRIGLGTVKALSEALSIPVFAVSRLRVLAAASQTRCAAFDAGRGEFFLGCYDPTIRKVLPGSLRQEQERSRERAAPALAGAPEEVLSQALGEDAAHSGREACEAGEWLLTAGEVVSRFQEASQRWSELAVCEAGVAAGFPAARQVASPTAADALRAALPAILAGHSVQVDELDGRYLRRSDLYRTAQPTSL